MRTVNVHEAKTQFSRLIDAAHAGETILVAKDGKPWARLVTLETDRPRRQPGLLRGQLQLPSIDVLLAPLPPEELDARSPVALLMAPIVLLRDPSAHHAIARRTEPRMGGQSQRGGTWAWCVCSCSRIAHASALASSA
jgi:prevent-host-death family protein